MKFQALWSTVEMKKRIQCLPLWNESEMCIRMMGAPRRKGLTSPDGWKQEGVRDSNGQGLGRSVEFLLQSRKLCIWQKKQ